MEGAEQTLVIILSAALAAFLLLGIVVLIKVIMLVNALKRVVDKADSLAEHAATLGSAMGRLAAPAAVGRLFAYLADNVFKPKSKRKETDDE